MNIQSSTNNYFRTASHIGINQKVESRKAIDLPGGILLWKAVAKVLLWSMPFVLGLNLLLSTLIQSQTQKIETLQQSIVAVEQINLELRTEKARLSSPANVKTEAAVKLALFEPAPGQIQRM